jgi:hypothetical protein
MGWDYVLWTWSYNGHFVHPPDDIWVNVDQEWKLYWQEKTEQLWATRVLVPLIPNPTSIDLRVNTGLRRETPARPQHRLLRFRRWPAHPFWPCCPFIIGYNLSVFCCHKAHPSRFPSVIITHLFLKPPSYESPRYLILCPVTFNMMNLSR